jgi:hypothetical protein
VEPAPATKPSAGVEPPSSKGAPPSSGGSEPEPTGGAKPSTAKALWDKANKWAEPWAEKGEPYAKRLEGSKAVQLGEKAHRGETAAGIYEHAKEKGEGGAGGGEGAGGASKGAAHGGDGGKGEGGAKKPLVETVNPKYKSPPGTKEQIAALEKDIEKVLAVRAAAEAKAAKAGAVGAKLQAQKGQITAVQKGAEKGVSATEAHKAVVERKDAKNKEREKSHQEGGSKTEDAANQLAGIATLETLLAGWTGFTSLVLKFADVLPGGMVSSFQKMNSDGAKFMASLVKTKAGIEAQKVQHGPRGVEIAATGAKIGAIKGQAGATGAQFTQAVAGGQKMQEMNAKDSAFVAAKKAKNQKDAARADDGASKLKNKKDTLAAQMEAWASEHKAARAKAVDETAKKLEATGAKVTKKPTH